ncbi:MAG: HIT family protein [Planctomycetaceae bacterium]
MARRGPDRPPGPKGHRHDRRPRRELEEDPDVPGPAHASPCLDTPVDVASERCVFCAIIAGDGLASVVYSDDLVTAFLDIRPVTPGHTLIVPKRHGASIADIDDDAYVRWFEVGRAVAAALLSSSLRAEGFNLIVADGDVAGQDISHAHLHVIPRFADDGYAFDDVAVRDWNDPPPTRTTLDEQAAELRRVLTSRVGRGRGSVPGPPTGSRSVRRVRGRLGC